MRNEDNRGKKIAFVSSCLLNSNNKVRGISRYAGAYVSLVNALIEKDIGIQQMDCPETLYLGVNRWSATKNLYSGINFRRFCRELAQKQVDYIESYYDIGYEIVGVFCINGSPTCGYDITCFDERWGGSLEKFSDGDCYIKGKGIYVEEMIGELQQRNIKMPIFYGLDIEDENIPLCVTENTIKKILDKGED